jgi:uncharacterized SAM-binding protein YcdF (DUF218 family)
MHRKAVYIPVLIFSVVVAYVAVNFAQVARQAQQDEKQRTDVIVIFGAAEYAGKPSPVFRARLDHGLDLFRQGLAPMVITTGGHGEDAKYAEGEVGRDYLIANGVPERSVIAETQSDDTAESAKRVAKIMRANGMSKCLAVSDGYHLFRIKRLMAAQGIETFGSPRPPSKAMTAEQRAGSYLREVLSLTLWRLHIT